jgi:hypothetical protein
MMGSLGINIAPRRAASSTQASYAVYTDALNTGTFVVHDADDTPLVGASGHIYAPVGPLPTLTTTTVTTTTSTTVTTTTLPSCAGTCGDGTVQADCSETCECAPTTDPVAAAVGCIGADVVPPEDDCVLCRGCLLDTSRCASPAGTTTTTLPGAGTTTTTLPGVGSTTTTMPAAHGTTTTSTLPAIPPPPCAGLSGAARARCTLDEALAHPLCGADPIPPKLDGALRTKLRAASTLLGASLSAEGTKQAHLVSKARRKLGAAGRQSAAAVRSKNAKRRLSAACAATIARLVADENAQIAARRSVR